MVFAMKFTDEHRALANARRLRLPLDEYRAKLAAGLRWCWRCKNWHPRAEFGPNRSDRDGLDRMCAASRRAYRRPYQRAYQRARRGDG